MGEALSDSLSNFIDKSPYSNNIDDGVVRIASAFVNFSQAQFQTTDCVLISDAQS